MALAKTTALNNGRNSGSDTQIQSLRAQLAGTLITMAHPEYDTARKIFNITVDRYPLAIVRAASAEDVAATIRFVREHDLPLAVRSGGHSVGRHSVIDDAVVLDLSEMKQNPAIYQFTAHQAQPLGVSIRSMFADELSDAALDAALTALERATSPYSAIQFRGLGGAMARVSRDATAFAHREQRYLVLLLGIWLDAAEDTGPHEAWTKELWEAIRAEGDGVYVNFLENEGDARLRDAYPAATLARLRAIKRAYDPHNLFRFNQNVRPTGEGA